MSAVSQKPPPFQPDDVVIVADDEMFSRFVLAEVLRGLGAPTVMSAQDGAELVEILNGPSAPFVRAVLLDFQMPGLNGLEVLKMLRCGELKAAASTNVLMITGMETLGLVAAAVALDVDAVLPKPVSSTAIAFHLRDIDNPLCLVSETEDYRHVDINIGAVGTTRSPAAITGLPQRDIALSEAKAGMILAEDVYAPTGALLVNAGVRLTDRLIRLLHGLAAGGVTVGTVSIRDGA